MSKTQDVIYQIVGDINELTGIIDALLKYTDKYQERVNDAITSISKAWNFTYDYYITKREILFQGLILPTYGMTQQQKQDL